MPRKSKSTTRKSEKLKQPTRNWLELPSDVALNILQRLDVADRLENVQKVCTAWSEICKDPSMWRVVYLEDKSNSSYVKPEFQEMCKRAVDRSQGQLLDLTVIDGFNDELLHYVADRSSQLRRLEMLYYYGEQMSEALKKLSKLEELSFVKINISQEVIEAVGRYCPLLKTLKLNHIGKAYLQNEIAFAIGKHLPELTHLQLIGSNINNTDLQAILDGCCHLESLDLRGCGNLDLKGELGKRCSQQIKHLKLPQDSLVGCPHSEDDYEDDYYYEDYMTCDCFDHNDYEDHRVEFDDIDDYYDYCYEINSRMGHIG